MFTTTDIGILQIGDKRVAVRPLRFERHFDGANEIVLTMIDDVFRVSNNLSKSKIKRVIFNNPATIVDWEDGTKTVVKCQPGDIYDEEKGLAMCIAKKFFGNKSNFNEVFKKWIPKVSNLSNDSLFLIEKTGNGCLGAEGLIGRKTDKPNTNGLLKTESGYNVETETGGVWRINLDAKIKYLK